MPISLNRRLYSIPLLTGVLSLAACHVNAQTASEDYSGISPLGQGGAAGSQALADNSCVPTSVANGLAYLATVAPAGTFSISPNTFTAVNALQSLMGTTTAGTSPASSLSGTVSYLSPTGPNPAPTVSVSQTFDPSASALASVLNQEDGVQLGILWGTVVGTTFNGGNGGHFVSLDSISLSSGTGTIGILDPWGNGGSHASTTATFDTLNVSTVNITTGLTPGTYLQVTYQVLGDFPNDVGSGSAFAGAGGTGLIALDQVEAVPEPSSLLISMLTTAGIGGFVVLRRRK